MTTKAKRKPATATPGEMGLLAIGVALAFVALGLALAGHSGLVLVIAIFAGMCFGYGLALIRARGEAHERQLLQGGQDS